MTVSMEKLLEKTIVPEPPVYGSEKFPEIPRVKNLSQEEFVREYYNKNLPVIIEDATSTWAAKKNWSFSYFKSKWGEVEFEPTLNLPPGIAAGFVNWSDYRKVMTLSQFIELAEDPPYPCYLRQSSIEKYPGVEKDFDFDLLDERTSQGDPVTSLWIQSAFVQSTLHFGNTNNFLVQMCGRKRVTLYAPSESKYLYQFEDTIRYSKVVPNAPDLDKYPNFVKAQGLQGVLNPGDALFIPILWWHHLCSLDKSVSLNCFYGPMWSWGELCQSVNSAGLKGWYQIMHDFVKLGIFKGKHKNRGMANIPIGLDIYLLMQGALRRRLNKHKSVPG